MVKYNGAVKFRYFFCLMGTTAPSFCIDRKNESNVLADSYMTKMRVHQNSDAPSSLTY